MSKKLLIDFESFIRNIIKLGGDNTIFFFFLSGDAFA